MTMIVQNFTTRGTHFYLENRCSKVYQPAHVRDDRDLARVAEV